MYEKTQYEKKEKMKTGESNTENILSKQHPCRPI